MYDNIRLNLEATFDGVEKLWGMCLQEKKFEAAYLQENRKLQEAVQLNKALARQLELCLQSLRYEQPPSLRRTDGQQIIDRGLHRPIPNDVIQEERMLDEDRSGLREDARVRNRTRLRQLAKSVLSGSKRLPNVAETEIELDSHN